MTHRSLALSLSLSTLTALGSFAPALAQTSAPSASASTPDAGTDSRAHSHKASTGLVLLGAVGGAALLGGGSHGQSGSSNSASPASASLTPAISGPQVLWTKTASSASTAPVPVPLSGLAAVLSAVKPSIATKAATASAASIMASTGPTLVFTYPTSVASGIASLTPTFAANGTLPTAPAVNHSPTTPTLSAAGLPQSHFSPAAVPEPAPIATLALGGFLLGGLMLRARRRSPAGDC